MPRRSPTFTGADCSGSIVLTEPAPVSWDCVELTFWCSVGSGALTRSMVFLPSAAAFSSP